MRFLGAGGVDWEGEEGAVVVGVEGVGMDEGVRETEGTGPPMDTTPPNSSLKEAVTASAAMPP